MANLQGMKCYLSGAIEFGPGEWRNEMTPWLESKGVVVLDPMNKRIKGFNETMEDVLRRRALKKNRCWDIIADEMRRIRCLDLRMVDLSDFIIVHIDLKTYTTGTWEEVSLANRQKKPIIFRIKQGKEHAPDWLFGMVHHEMIKETWVQVCSYLADVDRNGTMDSRWVFFK